MSEFKSFNWGTPTEEPVKKKPVNTQQSEFKSFDWNKQPEGSVALDKVPDLTDINQVPDKGLVNTGPIKGDTELLPGLSRFDEPQELPHIKKEPEQ